MMLEPSIDSLLEKIDSKYMLVTVSSRRARQLQEIENNKQEGPKENSETRKYIGQALDEIMNDELTYTYHGNSSSFEEK